MERIRDKYEMIAAKARYCSDIMTTLKEAVALHAWTEDLKARCIDDAVSAHAKGDGVGVAAAYEDEAKYRRLQRAKGATKADIERMGKMLRRELLKLEAML